MARLRVRVELSRSGAGVPLHKLASVVEEARKFFLMLGEDVAIDPARGEWLGFDFDHEAHFTAEYVVSGDRGAGGRGSTRRLTEPRRCAAPPSPNLRRSPRPSAKTS